MDRVLQVLGLVGTSVLGFTVALSFLATALLGLLNLHLVFQSGRLEFITLWFFFVVVQITSYYVLQRFRIVVRASFAVIVTASYFGVLVALGSGLEASG